MRVMRDASKLALVDFIRTTFQLLAAVRVRVTYIFFVRRDGYKYNWISRRNKLLDDRTEKTRLTIFGPF